MEWGGWWSGVSCMCTFLCCWFMKIPGETSQEVGLAGKKTLESVKAVSGLFVWEGRDRAGEGRGGAGEGSGRWEREVAG